VIPLRASPPLRGSFASVEDKEKGLSLTSRAAAAERLRRDLAEGEPFVAPGAAEGA